MSVEITACSEADDVLPTTGPVWHYFGGAPTPQDGNRFAPFITPERAYAARENGVIVGGCASFPLEMSVPGDTVKAAGVTTVGVMPTHRRRGILRRMMRAQLDDIHARGETVAALWASEDTIYGQFGYGMASLSGNIDVPRSANAFAQPNASRATFQILGETEALAPFAQVYERVRPQQPGMIRRSDEWWQHRRLADPESRRQGGGVLNRALLSYDGEPMAYALYRVHQQLDGGTTTGYVNVIEAVGAGTEATRDIWRFVFDIDWVASTKAMVLPLDHPLFFLLARPREMKFLIHDGLWIRLVDVPAAIAARRRGEGDPVVIEVADSFCNWNEGRWRLSSAGAERTTKDAELACDVTALGSVYLGGFTFRQLERAGRVTELRAGAAARADALLPPDGAPWCPEIF